jgi:hypothetical protein
MPKAETPPTESAHEPLTPEVATLLAMLAVDALLWAWQRQRLRMATQAYRLRREFAVALDSDGGVKALMVRSAPRWLRRPAPSRGRPA